MRKKILDGLLTPVVALLTLGIVICNGPFLYRLIGRQLDAIRQGFTPEYAGYRALQDAKNAGEISQELFNRIVERCWGWGE